MKDKETTILEPSLWVKRYADLMLNFAFRKTSDLKLSEDLVQETFLSALKAKENFKGNSQEKTWLFSILENKIVDYFRSNNYKFQQQKVAIGPEFFGHFFDKNDEERHWTTEQKPQEWSNLAENTSADNPEELDGAIQNCLKKLPQKLQQIFILKHIEEYNSEKICKELDITTSNYWVMIHRAKLQMRACLETNWYTK
jgi:RNA polymerase sigma-70 factor (TIGR02943 family)